MVAQAATMTRTGERGSVSQGKPTRGPEGGDGMEDNFNYHQPVMPRETVERLVLRQDGMYVDATVGEGGHASLVLQASAPQGIVLGVDRDPRSLARAVYRLARYGDRFIPLAGGYASLDDFASERGIAQVDGALFDLGFSSRQVEAEGYGFSFQRDEPLDMRFNPEEDLPTASHLVNDLSEQELGQLIFRYGEERRARAIARAIVRNRPINTTGALANLVAETLGARFHGRDSQRRGYGRVGRNRIHPATRTFQALRIAVNDELENLEKGLRAAIRLLAPGGRLVVISYHSLEDRIVKNMLAQEVASCTCPPGLPVCVCGQQPALRLVNRRVIRPGSAEVEANPRSRSGRMRVAEKLGERL